MRKRTVVIVAGSLLLVAGIVYVGYLKINSTSQTRLANKSLLSDLSKAKCSLKEQKQLETISTQDTNSFKAKALEQLSLCYIYNKKYDTALSTAQKSSDLYKKLDDNASLQRMQNSIAGLTMILQKTNSKVPGNIPNFNPN